MTLAGRPEGKKLNKEVIKMHWWELACAIFYGLLGLFTICFFVALVEGIFDQRRREKEQREREEFQRRHSQDSHTSSL